MIELYMTNNNVIPKIIWQTHEKDYKDLSKNFLKTSMTWKNLNQNWEYRYASAVDRKKEVKNFDKTLYEFYTILDKPNRADLWRYLVVYKYGGFYADMDSVCTMPLDYFLETRWQREEIITTSPGFQISPGFINISNFGAIKESNVLRLVLSGILEYYTKNFHKENISFKKLKEDRIEYNNLILCMLTYIIDMEQFKACYGLEAATTHGADFKKDFDRRRLEYLVDYFGEIKEYLTIAAENKWTTYC